MSLNILVPLVIKLSLGVERRLRQHGRQYHTPSFVSGVVINGFWPWGCYCMVTVTGSDRANGGPFLLLARCYFGWTRGLLSEQHSAQTRTTQCCRFDDGNSALFRVWFTHASGLEQPERIGNIRLPNQRQEKRETLLEPERMGEHGLVWSLCCSVCFLWQEKLLAVWISFTLHQICHQDREYIPSDSHPVTTESSQELPVLLSFHPDATQLYTHLDGTLCQLSSPDLFTGPAGTALNIWFCCNHLTLIQRQRVTISSSEDARTASRQPRWRPSDQWSELAFCDYYSLDKVKRFR